VTKNKVLFFGFLLTSFSECKKESVCPQGPQGRQGTQGPGGTSPQGQTGKARNTIPTHD